MMLNDLIEHVQIPNGLSIQLSGEERSNAPLNAQGSEYLEEFRLDDGVPVWTFRFGELFLEKRVLHSEQRICIYLRPVLLYRVAHSSGMRGQKEQGEMNVIRSEFELTTH